MTVKIRSLFPYLVGIAIALVIHFFVGSLIRVSGSSMEPTYFDGDRLVINKLPYLSSPSHGDVIIFHHPMEEGTYLVKRVIGLEGDTIEIKDGLVYRNGKALHENYKPTYPNLSPVVVPKEHVFVLGDHRSNSLDSRTYGTIPLSSLIGKVEFRVYPFD